jgi:hypothetical protein
MHGSYLYSGLYMRDTMMVGKRQHPNGEEGTIQGSTLLRRVLMWLTVAVVIASCSFGSESVDVAFEQVLDGSTGTSVWSASGEAIDTGLLCPTATSVFGGFEDEDGNPRTAQEFGTLWGRTDRLVTVGVHLMTCVDGSGEFTLRIINVVEPSLERAWTITGGSGYDNLEGDGEGELSAASEEGFTFKAAGTIGTG